MIVGNIAKIKGEEISNQEMERVVMKTLISPNEGWIDYVMRVVEVKENGYTPKHKHSWPHINYMIEGEGELMIEGKINEVSSGSYSYVPAMSLHQFRNTGKGSFRFICIVPKEGHK